MKRATLERGVLSLLTFRRLVQSNRFAIHGAGGCSMRGILIATAIVAIVLQAREVSAFVSFGDVAFLHPDANGDGRYDAAVDLATDGAGNWVAATTGPYVSTSSDNGVTWSTPVLVLPGNAAPGIWAYEPDVVTDGAGTWLLAWAEDPDGALFGVDAEVYLSRSTDNGATWTTGVPFASNAGTDLEYDNRPRLATDDAGKWMAVWHASDPVNDDDDLMFTTSSDNGLTWSAVDWIDPLAPFESQDDNWPTVATDATGNWVVAYNNNPSNTTGKLRVFRSTDFGTTWTGPKQINTTLGLTVADIESSGPGVFVVAHANLNANVSRSTDGGVNWTSAPVSGSLSAAQHRTRIATDRQGGWVIVWATNNDPDGKTGNDADVAVSRSADDGELWTSPAFLNLDASTDDEFEADDWPAIGTDGDGMWIAAWHREDTSSDNDQDIMIARSDPICPLQRRNDCVAPTVVGKGSLLVVNKIEDEKDAMKLKASNLGDTDKADFGTPLTTGSFALCQWDAEVDVDRLVTQVHLRSGGVCDGRPCWKESTTGYKYKDALNENGAVSKAQLKSGVGGNAKLSLQAKGIRLGTPVVPFNVDSSTAMQLISLETDTCWGATFSDTSNNRFDLYKAKSD